MTETADDLLGRYLVGLDLELVALETMLHLAEAQEVASETGDAEALLALLAQRSSTLSGLMDVEREIAGCRAKVAGQFGGAQARATPSVEDVRQRHRLAAERLSRIDGHDRRTLEHLSRAESTRRDSSQMLDAAEATLAAYRKALAPPESRSGLIDRRG